MKAMRLVAAAAAVCIMLLCLSSCKGESVALYVDSTSVNEEIFGYYLSVAENDSAYAEHGNKNELAQQLCAEYVTGLDMIEKYSVELSAKDKVAVSSRLKANWQMYSDFYEKYSVSKQTLCEIFEYEALIDLLTSKLYGAGGERETAENELKAYFSENYVAVKMAYTSFGKDADEKTVEEITDKYSAMADIIRAGGSFSSALEQYPDLADYEDSVKIINSADPAYPEEFFEKVHSHKNGDIQIMRYPRGIFLIQNADSSESFELYKSECIIKMKKALVLDEIVSAAQECKIEAA